MRDISLIAVPSHAGDERHPAAAGPGRLLDAGAAERLRAAGHDVFVELVKRVEPFRDTASSALEVNRGVADAVRRAHASGRFPLVVAGSCLTCLGVLAGFDHRRCGAVWLDAHGDCNTPDTTHSGFLPGMSLAIAVGHCYAEYWARIGDATPLGEDAVAIFGVRDLSPEAERDRLQRSEVRVVEWRDGMPLRPVVGVLDDLARRVGEVYLHVDLDAFAPETAPGVADEPVAGGLSFVDAETIVRGVADRFVIRAATLATYAPDHDRDDITLRLALRLIQLVGETAMGRASGRVRPGC